MPKTKKVKAAKKKGVEKKPVKKKKEENFREFLKPTGKTAPVLERVARAEEINLEQAVFAVQPREEGKEESGINYLNVSRDYASMGGGRKEERKVQYTELGVSYDTMLEKKKDEKETRKIFERNIGGEWRERGSAGEMEAQGFVRREEKEHEESWDGYGFG